MKDKSSPTPPRRTQAERSAATREALIRAARPMFATAGFAGVSTEAVVRAAGVTRGAMYHQFEDKVELFAAVFEAVEQDATARIASFEDGLDVEDAIELMKLGARAWLDVCGEAEVQRIVLVEAPAVLGWERWREVSLRYGMGLVQGMLTLAITSGRVDEQPVLPLAHVLIGALDEAAMYVARASDPATARADVEAVLDRLLDGLAT